MLVAIVMSITVMGFLLHDVWMWMHPPPGRYFFVDGKTMPRPAKALDSPIVDDTELLQWTVKWALAPYNVNYHDFPTQLTESGLHYTVAGWSSFANSYVGQGNFDKMKHAKLLCFAQPTRAAIIKARKIQFGRLGYLVQIPIVQTCENSNEENTQNLLINVTVERVDDDRDHPDGLAISQLIAKLQ